MNALLIKMSSMGDIFHTFPAITDLARFRPEIKLDWVVEEGLADIAGWHPAIHRVVPVGLRRWMRQRDMKSWQEFSTWKQSFRVTPYDVLIDAQGLLKSAVIGRFAHTGLRHGYDHASAREPLACLFYDQRHSIARTLHAAQRTRQLFGKVFDYEPGIPLHFGLQQRFARVGKDHRKLIFVIGTSWVTKLWSPDHWQSLVHLATEGDFAVELIWGSVDEQHLAQSIAAQCPGVVCSPRRLSITEVAERLASVAGVVGLDTGFTHLAGALETPTIGLFGPTSPINVGLIGAHTVNFQLSPALDCMPCHKRHCRLLPNDSSGVPTCMSKINAEFVWHELMQKMDQKSPKES
jgi:heptosyltransferase-1